MLFSCQSERHRHWSAAKADQCEPCRIESDARVRLFFKEQSDAMLRAAGVEPDVDRCGDVAFVVGDMPFEEETC